MAFKDTDICIVSFARTPIGAFQGSLSKLSAVDLAAIAIRAACDRAVVKGLPLTEINEVILGNVVSAGLGQSPAHQAAAKAGLPPYVPCSSVNKVCASGLKAVMNAAQCIASDPEAVIVAGGMESMSNAPYYLERARTGYRLGHGDIIDGMLKDGLWCALTDSHMGAVAEGCATQYAKTRTQQDDYAIMSYNRAKAAAAANLFSDEIVPVLDQRGDELFEMSNEEKLRRLKPAFGESGTITAGNASGLADGAAVLILISGKTARRLGVQPCARLLSWADACQRPSDFGTTPSIAIPKALLKAGVHLEDIDFFEINEAFSVVAIVNAELLNIPLHRVNVWGGAVALGHPLGCSGSRILITLLSVLNSKKARLGCAAICNGGGGASSVVVENLLPIQ